MEHYKNDAVIRQIKEVYEHLTKVEKGIADFFIRNDEIRDFSSKSLSAALYVSESSLSRFSQKCGYKGYRDFIYQYERFLSEEESTANFDSLTRQVISQYQDLLDQSLKLVNEEQMRRIACMLSSSRRVCTYGMGSSGIAAEEFKLRLMRLGVIIENAGDSHRIKMSAALVDQDVLVIGFSLSGNTAEVLDGLTIAKERGAKIVMITANPSEHLKNLCDEVLMVSNLLDLETGTMISPQFPILVMVDHFYTYFLHSDFIMKNAMHTETLAALHRDQPRNA